MAAVNFGVSLLPAEPLHVHHGQAEHLDVRQGLLDRFELRGLDQRDDQFHWVPAVPTPQTPESRVAPEDERAGGCLKSVLPGVVNCPGNGIAVNKNFGTPGSMPAVGSSPDERAGRGADERPAAPLRGTRRPTSTPVDASAGPSFAITSAGSYRPCSSGGAGSTPRRGTTWCSAPGPVPVPAGFRG